MPVTQGCRVGRAVFLGSPAFAVPSLQALAEVAEVALVVTQPDRPAGRGRRLQEPAVKVAAQELGLPVWQPESLRGRSARERLRETGADCGVVVAYGEILRPAMLGTLPRGFLNVHASLLPRHRGASPVAGAILAGDEETGVSAMLLDAGMDTGPVLRSVRTTIAAGETRGELERRLAELGGELTREVWPLWLQGSLVPVPQEEALATMTRPLGREDGRLDWGRPAQKLERQCRAMDPWPGTFTTWDGRLLKVWGVAADGGTPGAPGEVQRDRQGVSVSCGQGALRLTRVQLEGRAAMGVTNFIQGNQQFVGARLGD